MTRYEGTGQITEEDYKAVKWVGKTKGGSAVTIVMEEAINMGNIDWTMADKDDTVAQIVFTAVYGNTDQITEDTKEPWTIEIEKESSGAPEIMLGAGLFYINEKLIALTRGGGKFTVERTFREISADGDRGPVKGRIVIDGSKATLTLNTIQILSRINDLYPAVKKQENVQQGEMEENV